MQIKISGLAIDLKPESEEDIKILNLLLEKKTLTVLPQLGASTKKLKGVRIEHLPDILNLANIIKKKRS